jgi:hypothetical protein
MGRQIWVKSDGLKRCVSVRIVDGVELSIAISPYSTPKAVVGTYDRTSGRFNINFKYIDNEPPRATLVDSHGVLIREGRFSRKILGISIPTDQPPLDKVAVSGLRTRILDAFKERSRIFSDTAAPDAPDLLNQDVAEEILNEKAIAELIGPVSPR